MFVMQYSIPLPADYDMAIIKNRVATRGHALDAYLGLGAKAYLIREVGIDDSAVNCYAPLYVWRSTEAAARFLWRGDGFGGIVRDFGRPSVWTWLGGRFQAGRHAGATVPAAVHIQRRPLPAEVDPGQIATATDDLLDAATQNDGVHIAGYAIDPTTWNAIEIRLVAASVPAEAGEVRYQLLHLSKPDLSFLSGRGE
jgi:hypothetical protein